MERLNFRKRMTDCPFSAPILTAFVCENFQAGDVQKIRKSGMTAEDKNRM